MRALRPPAIAFVFLVLASSSILLPQAVTRRGYVRISAIPGPPFCVSLISYSDSSSTLIAQTAAEAQPPRTSGMVSLDEAAGRTVLTLTNTQSNSTTVVLILRDARGEENGRRMATLEPGHQLTLDANDTFSLPRAWTGSLQVTANSPIALYAALERVDDRGNRTAAALPLADESTLELTSSVVPILSLDDYIPRQLVLLNPSRANLRGSISFIEKDGSASPSGTRASETYSIAPGGITTLDVSNSGPPQDRYVRITPESGQAAPAAAVYGASGSARNDPVLPARQMARTVRGVVETVGSETRIVVTNPDNRAQEAAFRLLDRFGDVTAEATQTLAPAQMVHVRIEDIFPGARFGFSGQFEVEGESQLSVTSVRRTVNARGEQIMAFVPVSDRNARRAGPLVGPFVSGDGAETRLLLLNTQSAIAQGEIAFFQDNGTSLEVQNAAERRSVFPLALQNGSRLQLFPDNPRRAATISLRDPVSNRASTEIIVNAGSSVRAPVLVLDDTGVARDDLALSFRSVSEGVAVADLSGNITGRTPGFSTLAIASGERVLTATITVVGVDYGGGGFEITGIGQDLNRRVYLAAASEHIVLTSDSVAQMPRLWAGGVSNPGFRNDLRLLSLFRSPSFLAVNQFDGSVYVSDTANHAVRRIRTGTSGTVETLAGGRNRGAADGTGPDAMFGGPQGVAVDARGFLWIADSLNHTIRRMSLLTRRVQTIAGAPGIPGNVDGPGPEARFREPTGIVVETETVAQQLERERRGDPPPPVSIIVADTGNGLLRRVNEDGTVETLSRLTSVSTVSAAPARPDRQALTADPLRFDAPFAVALDSAGNIFVSEAGSRQVRTVLTNGEIVAAAQPNTFASPRGLLLADSGRLLVADRGRPFQEVRFGAPLLTELVPDRTSIRGGADVRIRGRNFAPESKVILGGVVVADATVRDTETITFKSPALPSGLTTITVLNRGGIAQRSFLVEPIPLNELLPGQITTVAGGSTFTGDGASAQSAVIASPEQVAVDAIGDLYIADSGNHRIRRVDRASGIITTIAGNGTAGFGGDGALAIAATLTFPEGVAIDRAGNLFIADTGNSRVRRVDAATGLISTIAGTRIGFSGDGSPAVSAMLNAPRGLAFDQSGRLLVADSGNHRIRRIDAAGVITTIAGNEKVGFSGDGAPATSTSLNSPRAVAVDREDQPWIADTFNHRIRRIDPDGTIRTVAGTGEPGFNGDNRPATSSSLNFPYSMAFEDSGGVVVADSRNHRLRGIANGGLIRTIAGDGEAGFSGDGARAVDARLNEPRGVATAGGGLIVSDRSNHRVRQIGEANGPASPFGVTREVRITTVAGTGQRSFEPDPLVPAATNLRSPLGLAIDSQGNVLVSDSANHRILAVSARGVRVVAGTGSAGESGDGGSAVSAMLNFPQGLATDRLGNLYIADTGNHRIRQVRPDGTIRTLAGNGLPGFLGDDGPASAGSLLSPSDVAIDLAGNIYVADTGNSRVRKVDATSGRIITIAGSGEFGFSGDESPAVRASLNTPRGVAVDSAGNVFIADTSNHRLRRVDAVTGAIRTVAGNGGTAFAGDGGPAREATLNAPVQIAVDELGNLFVADTFNHRVRLISATTGVITTIAGNGQRGFSGDGGPADRTSLFAPSAVRLDSQGNVFIADTTNERVRAIRRPLSTSAFQR